MVWRPPRACPRRAANKVRCTDTGLQLHQRERKEPPLDALEDVRVRVRVRVRVGVRVRVRVRVRVSANLEDGEEEHGGGRVLQR